MSLSEYVGAEYMHAEKLPSVDGDHCVNIGERKQYGSLLQGISDTIISTEVPDVLEAGQMSCGWIGRLLSEGHQ